jgi:hypothetical protein
MAVILRTLNVLNPAIPPINAKIRFMVDRPVLIGRTALAALLTFGLSFMVLRRLIPGRYAALVSVMSENLLEQGERSINAYCICSMENN